MPQYSGTLPGTAPPDRPRAEAHSRPRLPIRDTRGCRRSPRVSDVFGESSLLDPKRPGLDRRRIHVGLHSAWHESAGEC